MAKNKSDNFLNKVKGFILKDNVWKKNKKQKKEIEPRNLWKEFLDLWKDLIIIVLIVVFIRTFLVMPFQINGASMSDSYYDREFIIVDRFSYLSVPVIKKWNPNRWDVIVFRPHVDKIREFYIKRIIWLPWDTLKINDWRVYVLDKKSGDYRELIEWYLSDTNRNSTFVRWEQWETIYKVPKDSYFVMWDNRNWSTDSRACFQTCLLPWRTNFIVKSDIVWKVFIDLWYYNIINNIKFNPFEIKFWTFSFMHPNLGIDTHPKWFSSPSNYEYK